MSGILDNKSRVLDTIITEEGRRQLSEGGIDIAYVSFSDAATFYRADIASGSQDATQRIYLESCQLPQDLVTFQADDSGNVLPFPTTANVGQGAGSILQYTYTGVTSSSIGGSRQGMLAMSGSLFADAAQQLLGSSIGNFNKLMVLATRDTIFEDAGFATGPNSLGFTINNDRPIRNPKNFATHISSIDSIFADPRFQGIPNFHYLPPINKVATQGATHISSADISDPSQTSDIQLGTYPPWGRTHKLGLSYAQIMYELKYYEQLGYMRKVSFDPTSISNNLIGQMFEVNHRKLRKLDVVDFGAVRTNIPGSPWAHIFFVGKVSVDENGTDTFIHLFTLVFE
jgi:hypothetical protein